MLSSLSSSSLRGNANSQPQGALPHIATRATSVFSTVSPQLSRPTRLTFGPTPHPTPCPVPFRDSRYFPVRLELYALVPHAPFFPLALRLEDTGTPHTRFGTLRARNRFPLWVWFFSRLRLSVFLISPSPFLASFQPLQVTLVFVWRAWVGYAPPFVGPSLFLR